MEGARYRRPEGAGGSSAGPGALGCGRGSGGGGRGIGMAAGGGGSPRARYSAAVRSAGTADFRGAAYIFFADEADALEPATPA